MKSNIWILALSLFGVVQFASAQFNFKKHEVIKGDDVYSIAKEYNTTPEAIYELNPMAKIGIQPGTFIVLPNVIAPPEKHVEGISFKRHKTRSKETLYSVAKKYKVTVEDIKTYNEFLQSEPLRKGDIIKIPLPAPKTNKVVRKIGKKNKDADEAPKTKIYTIQPKDTRYGIARKFGLTIPELDNMNPNLGDSFPIGTQILVAKEEAFPNATEDAEDTTFELYEVKPKETLYSLGKRYEISIDSIGVLNPNVLDKEGLKAGMVLKLPNLFGSTEFLESEAILMNLENNIVNTSNKNIAVLLPFNLNKADFSDEESIKNHLNSKSVSISADFYSGVLMAIEKAKRKGISTTLEVCDTRKSDKVVEQLIINKNLNSFDAVIGPLFKKNVEKAVNELKDSEVLVLSPITKKVNTNSEKFYQTRPTNTVLEDKIIAFAKKDSLREKNIIIIADKKSRSVKSKLQESFPKAKFLDPEAENFVKEEKLIEVFGEEESEIPTWVFLETKSPELISNVIPFLNARRKTHKVTLFTTEKSSAYEKNESILNQHLSNLNFHFPSVTNDSNNSTKRNFIKSYFSKFKVKPNSYAIRGFDLTYDLLLRLSVIEESREFSRNNYITEYVENKFLYVKNENGGYTNKSSYILCYKPGLEIEIVE